MSSPSWDQTGADPLADVDAAIIEAHEKWRPPTADEVARVKRQECRDHGHEWRALLRFGDEFPTAFVCERCPAHLTVTEATG